MFEKRVTLSNYLNTSTGMCFVPPKEISLGGPDGTQQNS